MQDSGELEKGLFNLRPRQNNDKMLLPRTANGRAVVEDEEREGEGRTGRDLTPYLSC